MQPSRETEKEAAQLAAAYGRINILKYVVEERKISDELKITLLGAATAYGRLDCLKYFVEEAKAPLDNWQYIACARYYEQPECEDYLLEKGSPEPTHEEYAKLVQDRQPAHEEENGD